MAISTPFTPNFPLNLVPSSQSISSSVRFGRPRISTAYSTAKGESRKPLPQTDTSSFSLYDVLGIQMGADTGEVKSAYRKLARVLHPDVRSGESSAEEFMKVHSAYTTLVDPARRADYDRNMLQRRIWIASPLRSVDGYRGRKWETDQCW